MKKNKSVRRRNFINILFLILVVILFSKFVLATPNTINIQGKLTGSSGSLQTGTFNFSFRIYDAYTGGIKLYETNVTETTDSRAVFDIILQKNRDK